MYRFTTISLLLSALFLGSCSTMSFLPTEGGASKFNLATVEYVQAQNGAQKIELLEEFAGTLSTILDSLLIPDRVALAELSTNVDSLELIILEFSSQIDSSRLHTDEKLAAMLNELTTVKANASSTRMVIQRINDDVDALPKKALMTFNEAISAYLNKKSEQTE